MCFDLDHGPAFIYGVGEPYDRGAYTDHESAFPTSLFMAISTMSSDHWASLAEEVFNCSPEHLTPETVLERAIETDTCRSLATPTEVYIDSTRTYSVHVY